ncbi:MAG: PstA family ABC transporter permease [Pirellulaceae bacterium]
MIDKSTATDVPETDRQNHRSLAARHRIDRWFVRFCQLVALFSVVILAVLLSSVLINGLPALDWSFVTGSGSSDPNKAGIRPALLGSMWLCGVCALFALPIGVATAIYLEEFKPHNKIAQHFHAFVQLNISNLAGVPSVVYGIIGLTAFASMFGIFGTVNDPAFEVGAEYFDQFLSEGDRILLVAVDGPSAPETAPQPGMIALSSLGQEIKVNVIGKKDPLPKDKAVRAVTLRSDTESGRINNKSWYFFRLPMGRGVLAGGMTLMLVILPIVIIASQEALRAVPDSLREGSFGMGATRWQTVQNVTLPSSIPGIMTGSILAMSRAIGEAAPVLIICGIVYISSGPGNLMDDFSVMPLQIFNWTARPQAEFQTVAAKGILVLLALLLSFNTVAVLIRNKTQKSLS